MVIKFYGGYSGPLSYEGPHKGGTEKTLVTLAKALSKRQDVTKVFVTGANIIPSTHYKLEFTDDINVKSNILIAVSYSHFLYEIDYESYDESYFWIHNEKSDGFYFKWHKSSLLDDTKFVKDLSICKKFKSVVCVSKWHLEEFKRYYNLPATFIYNSISELFFEDYINYEEDRKFISYISHPERGLSKVLSDWEESIYPNNPDSILAIAIPKYSIEYYEKHFRDRVNNTEGILFFGNLSESGIVRLLRNTKIFYYPTDYPETFCLSYVEAVLSGAIPVLNPSGALNEVSEGYYHDLNYTDLSNLDNIDKISLSDSFIKKYTPDKISSEWVKLIKKESMSNLKVDAVYVICMDPDDQKNLNLYKEFKKLNIDVDDNRFMVFKAVDGRDPDVDFEWNLYKKWKIDSDNDYWNRDITPGEIGCSLSHLSVWRHANSQKYKTILVLEEDFKVTGPWDVDHLPQESWGMIYLGRQKKEDGEVELDEHYVIPRYSWLSHAYLLSDTGINRILEQGFENFIMPVDEFLPACYSIHPRSDLDFIWRDLAAFSLKNHIVSQTSNKTTSRTSGGLYTRGLYNIRDFDRWSNKYVSPSLVSGQYDLILDEPITNVYHFRAVTEKFCKELIEIAEAENKWTEDRHYNFPTHDMLLSSIKLDTMYNKFLESFIYPIIREKYCLWGSKWKNLEAENFIAKYTVDQQPSLALHHDDSQISTVLLLNDDFEGGGTYFSHQKTLLKGKVGEISIHPGQITHRHGAREVISGTRYVVVSFIRISSENKVMFTKDEFKEILNKVDYLGSQLKDNPNSGILSEIKDLLQNS